jgi:hypothetical protein
MGDRAVHQPDALRLRGAEDPAAGEDLHRAPGADQAGRRWVPPKPGVMPRPTSGWPNLAFSDAMRMSQAMASSQPPPSAKPPIARDDDFGQGFEPLEHTAAQSAPIPGPGD